MAPLPHRRAGAPPPLADPAPLPLCPHHRACVDPKPFPPPSWSTSITGGSSALPHRRAEAPHHRADPMPLPLLPHHRVWIHMIHALPHSECRIKHGGAPSPSLSGESGGGAALSGGGSYLGLGVGSTVVSATVSPVGIEHNYSHEGPYFYALDAPWCSVYLSTP